MKLPSDESESMIGHINCIKDNNRETGGGGHSPGNRGKVRGKGFDDNVREKSGIFMKNCQRQGNVDENEIVLQMS